MKNGIQIVGILLSLMLTGCAGFMNGYLADCPGNSEFRQVQASSFPAIKSDLYLMRQNHQSERSIVGKTLFDTMMVIDVPISACVDTIFLPFRGVGYLIHGKRDAENTTVER
jgi:uncharacterized protein YceK